MLASNWLDDRTMSKSTHRPTGRGLFCPAEISVSRLGSVGARQRVRWDIEVGHYRLAFWRVARAQAAIGRMVDAPAGPTNISALKSRRLPPPRNLRGQLWGQKRAGPPPGMPSGGAVGDAGTGSQPALGAPRNGVFHHPRVPFPATPPERGASAFAALPVGFDEEGRDGPGPLTARPACRGEGRTRGRVCQSRSR